MNELIQFLFVQLFALKVRVPGYNYVGAGNSTGKKEAQSNAARDFLMYLVRVGEVREVDVPSLAQVRLLMWKMKSVS